MCEEGRVPCNDTAQHELIVTDVDLCRLFQKVKVLLHRCWFDLASSDAACLASFEVKSVLKSLSFRDLQCVLHQHDVDFSHALRVQRENPKNLDQQRIRVLIQMVEVCVLYPQKSTQLRTCHRFDDKPLVV